MGGGGGASSISNGLVDCGEVSSRGRFIVRPAVALMGDRDRVVEPVSAGFRPPVPLSPRRTKVSMDFSRFPPSPFKTARLLFSSLKPISRSLAIFKSKS